MYLNQVSQCTRREEGDSLKKYCLAAGDFAQFMKDLLDQSLLAFHPYEIPDVNPRGS